MPNMPPRIKAGRLLAYKTLWLRDQGLLHTKESAMCKWFCTEVAVHAIHDLLILFGHRGFSEDSPLEQRLGDVIGFEIAEGTPQIQRLIIARELLGD